MPRCAEYHPVRKGLIEQQQVEARGEVVGHAKRSKYCTLRRSIQLTVVDFEGALNLLGHG